VLVFSGDFGDEVSVTTDTGGKFSVSGFPARTWSISAVARAEAGGGLVAAGGAQSYSANAGGTTDLGSFEIDPYDPAGDPGTSFTGRIVDGTGRPVAGARVSADAQFLFFTTTTAEDGRFLLTGMPSNSPITVGAARSDACRYYNTRGVTPSGRPGEAVDLGTFVLLPDQPLPPPV
jgi:hypothetical protein